MCRSLKIKSVSGKKCRGHRRSLNPRKVVAMDIFPIIVHFIAYRPRARCMAWRVNLRAQ